MGELFVVGVGRSGTSLVQSMLAGHSAIAMLPETGFFRRYVASGDTGYIGLRDAREHDARLARLDLDCIDGRNRDAVDAYRYLLSPAQAGCLSGKASESVKYCADKDPRLIEYLPALRALFPESHVVHIVRDPRDVLASKKQAAWSRERHWILNALIGRLQLDLAAYTGLSEFGWRYHVLRYEDLIQDPVSELTRLSHELDLEFEPSMLKFGEAAERLTASDREPWKRETRGPLLTSNSGKWRHALPTRHALVVEKVHGSWVRRYGYETSGRACVGWRAAAWAASCAYRLFRSHRVRSLIARIQPP